MKPRFTIYLLPRLAYTLMLPNRTTIAGTIAGYADHTNLINCSSFANITVNNGGQSSGNFAEERSFKAGSRATNRVQRVTGEIEVIVNKEENRGGVKRGIISVNKVREKDPLVGGMNNVRVRLGAFSG